MEQTTSLKQKIKKLYLLILPIFITQISTQLLSFADIVMSGRFSSNDLAGVAIATSIWVPILTGSLGLFLAIVPIISQHLGENNKAIISSKVTQMLYLSIAISSVVITAILLFSNSILTIMNLDKEVHRIAHQYLIAISAGILPFFLSLVLRSTIDGLGLTKITMYFTFLGLPINILLNFLFIFGYFHFPRLGGVGSGVATAITYYILFTIMFIWVKKNPFTRSLHLLQKFEKVSFTQWLEFLKIGIPIGLAIFFEVAIFSSVTLLLSKYGSLTIAAHQSALNFASLLYMFPYSISAALTIIIGFEVGAKRFTDAKIYARIGIISAVSLAICFAVLLFFFRSTIAGFYTNKVHLNVLIQSFLVYAIFFQLSDAIASPTQGILRGYKDVNIVAAVMFISFWIIGLPTGILIEKFTSFQAYSYWIGLIVGLAFGAICLLLRLHIIEKRIGLSLDK